MPREDFTRDEFKLLNKQIQELIYSLKPESPPLDKQTLMDFKHHIKLCEHLPPTDAEEHMLVVAKALWDAAAKKVKEDIEDMRPLFFTVPKPTALQKYEARPQNESDSANPQQPYELTKKDKRFLKSLKIGAGDPKDNEENWR